jgi:glycosyltransferase involved in cell wall biosynthesis
MDLVEALDLLENPPVIDCYGEGPERERIERAAAQGRVEGRVRLHGRVDNAAEKYREAQFAVLASHEEGLPNAVLEAMASGLPVIATSVGGTPELIAHGETGLLVPPRAPLELARAIETIINDPSLRVELGRRARRRIEERFSWDKCVREHEDLYRGL